MHLVNTFFGHLAVLARYVGVEERRIVGYLQHGWVEIGPVADAPFLPLVPHLVWSDANVVEARQHGLRPIVAIGAPRLYLDGGHAPPPPDAGEPAGTIVYPNHSWDYDVDDGNIAQGPPRDEHYGTSHERFAREIAARETGPVTVALFWRDFEEDAARRPYEEAGFRVITHGTRFEPDFLARQRAEQVRHVRAVANRVGSAVWYAGWSGLELEVYGPFTGATPAEASWFHRQQTQRWPQLFRGGVNRDEARHLAGEQLGAGNKRAPEELADILGWRGWRRLVAPAVDVLDRAHHRLRWPAFERRLHETPDVWLEGDPATGGGRSGP